MKESAVSAGDVRESEEEEEEDGESTSESASIDAQLLQTKFASLASALQETNQNLVTFEYLLEHSRKMERHSATPKGENTKDNNEGCDNDSKEDIVNLLKDICGSVNDLRSEMGQNITAADVKTHDLKPQNTGELTDLKDRCNKLEFEVECLKSKLSTSEQKLLEEKRKIIDLETIIQDQKQENRKLGLFLKEADDFSKESERECRYLKSEIIDIKQELNRESQSKESLSKDLENIKKLYAEYEDKIKINNSFEDENRNLHDIIRDREELLGLEREEKQRVISDLAECQDRIRELEAGLGNPLPVVDLPALDLDGVQTSRSTLSTEETERSHEELRASHKRLKQKTRQLLKQYRSKRSQLERKERQLGLQKAGLMKLQTLHQSVESNHYIVIHHLGQQLVQIAKLVATLWPETENVLDKLYTERENKLSEWILYIDNLSSWVVQKLVTISVRKRDKLGSLQDTEAALSDVEANKRSLDISEAARNEESVLFKEIQKELITGLEQKDGSEQTDADTSLGTWM